MAAAAVAHNNAPSPRSASTASSPRNHTSRLSSHSNAPLYTQEDVIRYVQAALAATCRDQAIHSQARSSNPQDLQEERVMKPRVHMYETFGAKRTMITTLELPGLQKNDVSITARPNGDLVISGERRAQHLLFLHNHNDDSEKCDEGGEQGRTVFNELKFGRFQRVIRLPLGTDPTTISASMDDGMLTISWPLPPSTSATEQRMSHPTVVDTRMEDLDSRHASL